MGQSMEKLDGTSIMEQLMKSLGGEESMASLRGNAREYKNIIQRKMTDCYIQQQQKKKKNTKVYLRGLHMSTSVWFELDLSQLLLVQNENSVIKVRRMPWVHAYHSKPNCKVASIGSSIYLLGGETINNDHDINELHNDVFCLDTSTNLYGANQFEVAKSMLGGHLDLHTVVLEGKMYILSDYGEVFDPESNSWNRFKGPTLDPHLKRTLGSYSDPFNHRILVYFCGDNGYPLYEYRPNVHPSWTCINSNFIPSNIRLELSVLLDDFIIGHLEDSPDFVAYDFKQHTWLPLEWTSDIKFDTSLFDKYQSWSCLLHLGNGTLLMLRALPHLEHGCQNNASNKIRVDCLTFKVAKSYCGTILASAPTAKSVVLEGTSTIEDYIIL